MRSRSLLWVYEHAATIRSQCQKIGDAFLGTRTLGTIRFLQSIVLTLFMFFLASDTAEARPDLHWRTIESEHFVLHYAAGQEELANRIIPISERAYGELSREFGHELRQKVHVILTDIVDSSNGSANSVPYPYINLFATSPESVSPLGSNDNWMDVLIVHELTHVVHLSINHGLPRWINLVFGLGGLGTVYQPNHIWPRWFTEGLATQKESQFTSQGRYRSAIYDMIVRSAVLENRVPSINQLSNDPRIFPHGSTAYLYGLHFVHYIVNHYGQDKVRELIHVYGSRTIPFGINRVFRDVFGASLDQVWEEFVQENKDRFIAQSREIRAKGLKQGRRLTFTSSPATSSSHTRYPTWSSDDRWIYFFDNDGHTRPGIRRIPATGTNIREGVGFGNQGAGKGIQRVFTVLDASRASFLNDEQIVFSMRGIHDRRYSWNDLYLWSAEKRWKRKQLTFGARASEPNVSPSGRQIAFIRADTGQSRLAIYDLNTNEVVELPPVDPQQYVYGPSWSPNGKDIVYSMWLPGGYRDIYVYHRETGKNERITADRFVDESPTYSPDAKFILFSSDRTGTFNIFAYAIEEEKTYQVTNVLGGAFEPSLSHSGKHLAYVGFSSMGYDLWLMDFKESELRIHVLPPQSLAHHGTPELSENHGSNNKPASLKSKPYRAWKTFYPRSLFPSALEFQSSEFLTDLSLSLEISDVVGFHRLLVNGRFNANTRSPAVSASYVFSRFLPNLQLGFGRGTSLRNGFSRFLYEPSDSNFVPEDSGYFRQVYRERATSGRAELSIPLLRHPQHNSNGSVEYSFSHIENLDLKQLELDPNAPAAIFPEVGNFAALSLGWSYSNQEGRRFGYSSLFGRRISMRLSVYDRRLGGDYNDVRFRGSYTEAIRLPWRGQHVLTSRISGGWSSRGLRRRGAYTLGGFGLEQDIIRRVLTRSAISEAGVLRGYSPNVFSGSYFTLINTEYRLPLLDAEWGLSTVPAYLQRIVFVGFTDWGMAWSRQIKASDLVGSLGASLIVQLKVGYRDFLGLMFQYARGLDPEHGINYFRAVVAGSF